MMRIRPSLIRALCASTHANAAVEMALVAPMLIILIFGSFELGNYFLSEHVVAKAVRDGARYASRRSFADFTCPSTLDTDVIDKVRNLTRTGQIASGGTGRLNNWTSANAISTISVTMNCIAVSGGNYSGIYNGMANLPKVKVTAAVPYNSLFDNLGFGSSALMLHASSESAVMGI
jgi:Flp pilus assembly protein TadG